jgi:hypothetical protein
MSKKTLNFEAITSELTGASLFFQQKRDTPTLADNDPQPLNDIEANTRNGNAADTSIVAKNVHSDGRTDGRTNVHKPARSIIRHAFDIYADQLYALQALQLEAVQRGRKKPKLGSMVQKALDLYLQKQAKK